MDSDAYEARTDRLVEILEGDVRLSEGLAEGATVTVHRGLPHLGPEPGCHVWVYFGGIARVEHQVLMNGTRQTQDGMWDIWFGTQQPEVVSVEQQVERLGANLVRILSDYVEEAGLWSYGVLTRMDAGVAGSEQWGFFRLCRWEMLLRFRLVTP